MKNLAHKGWERAHNQEEFTLKKSDRLISSRKLMKQESELINSEDRLIKDGDGLMIEELSLIKIVIRLITSGKLHK
jgi:hypothetical protein